MDAAKRMIQQVLDKGTQEVTTYLTVEKEKIDDQTKKEVQRVLDQEKEAIQKSVKAVEKEYEQYFQRQETSFRQETLHRKQAFLQRLFEEAIEVMNQWDKEQTQAFCTKGMLQVPDCKDAQIILGEQSKNKLDKQWLETINTQKNYPLIFAKETAKNEGGFIVSQKGIEYNFLFSSLVNEIKESESFKVAELLFKES